MVVVIEELGRAVAPGPFVPTVTVSAMIEAIGSEVQKARLLPGLVDGSVTAAIGFGGQVTLVECRSNRGRGCRAQAGLADTAAAGRR